MKFAKMALLAAGIAMGLSLFGANAENKEARKLLVAGPPNYNAMYTEQFKPFGFVTTAIQKNNEKAWKDQGWVLPKYEELKKYDVVLIAPLANLLKENKADVVEYVKNGGTILFLYNSLIGTKARTGEVGFGICGFDKLSDGKEALSKLSYTGKMPKRDFEQKGDYMIYASDLVDAEALIVNSEKKSMAYATVTKFGKGLFIFYGGENKTVLFDILKTCGVIK